MVKYFKVWGFKHFVGNFLNRCERCNSPVKTGGCTSTSSRCNKISKQKLEGKKCKISSRYRKPKSNIRAIRAKKI